MVKPAPTEEQRKAAKSRVVKENAVKKIIAEAAAAAAEEFARLSRFNYPRGSFPPNPDADEGDTLLAALREEEAAEKPRAWDEWR